jgi:hypothetical protein
MTPTEEEPFEVALGGAGPLGLLLMPSPQGLRVSGFDPGSAQAAAVAQEQGVRRGCVLLHCNGASLGPGASVLDFVAARGSPGSRVVLRVRASSCPMPGSGTAGQRALVVAAAVVLLSALLHWLYATQVLPYHRACLANSACRHNVAVSLWADYGVPALIGGGGGGGGGGGDPALLPTATLLRALVRPIASWERFRACYWERDLHLRRHGGGGGATAAPAPPPPLLLQRGDVLAMVNRAVSTDRGNEGGALRASTDLILSKESTFISGVSAVERGGAGGGGGGGTGGEGGHPADLPVDAVLQFVQHQGYSLVLNHMQYRHAGVAALAAALRRELGLVTNANLYCTPGAEQAFRVHYDARETFVLHLNGRKRWRVFAPVDRERLFLVRDADPNVGSAALAAWLRLDEAEQTTAAAAAASNSDGQRQQQQQQQQQRAIFDGELSPGDVLFMPRGFPHLARAVAGSGIGGGRGGADASDGGGGGGPGAELGLTCHLSVSAHTALHQTWEGAAQLLAAAKRRPSGGGGGSGDVRLAAATAVSPRALRHMIVRCAANELPALRGGLPPWLLLARRGASGHLALAARAADALQSVLAPLCHPTNGTGAKGSGYDDGARCDEASSPPSWYSAAGAASATTLQTGGGRWSAGGLLSCIREWKEPPESASTEEKLALRTGQGDVSVVLRQLATLSGAGGSASDDAVARDILAAVRSVADSPRGPPPTSSEAAQLHAALDASVQLAVRGLCAAAADGALVAGAVAFILDKTQAAIAREEALIVRHLRRHGQPVRGLK